MANPNKPTSSQPAKPGAITPATHNPPAAPQGQPVPAAQPPIRVEINAPQQPNPVATQPHQAPAQQQQPAQTAANNGAYNAQPGNPNVRGVPGDGPTTRPDAGGQTPSNPTPAAATPNGLAPAAASTSPGPGQGGGQAPAGR